MSLLAFDLITHDLKELKSNLKNDVTNFFKKTVWDEHPYEVEVDWSTWNKMMETGTTNKSASTRRCLDAKRRLNDCLLNGGSDGKGEEYGTKGFMGSRTLIGVKL